MIAELRGDYPQAEQRYQASLAIDEELGDRAGISSSYHQLGMIAQRRGDYPQAEQRYQASLAIKEELGDRAGVASSTSQLGVLRTVQGRSAEGIRYSIGALALRLEIESSAASTDVYWLAKQRQETGDEAFTRILGELLDVDSVQFVIDAVNRQDERV
jgi:tetratricopeptide (TPR) repeat protein